MSATFKRKLTKCDCVNVYDELYMVFVESNVMIFQLAILVDPRYRSISTMKYNIGISFLQTFQHQALKGLDI